MSTRPSFRRKDKPRRIGNWPEGVDAARKVSARVNFACNTEHKSYPSAAGTPALHSDKAKCDKYERRDIPKLREALRKAIEAECVGEEFRGGYPARAWVWISEVLHEAKLYQQEQGEYHGFPIDDPSQYPEPEKLLKERAPPC